MSLPDAVLDRPLAHRGLHGEAGPENSLDAIRAAFAAGYGCEIDVQPSRDGRAMVFHDATLDRMTDRTGPVRVRDADDLARIALRGGGTIPRLAEVLATAGGPLLIELKAQPADDGVLERAVASDLAGHAGPVAVMSFDPRMVARMASLLPDVPRGLTTAAYDDGWDLPRAIRDRLREIPDYAAVGATFISHEASDLDRPRVGELKSQGAAILCWTIRSEAEELAARTVAHNVTFEGYLPRLTRSRGCPSEAP